MNFLKLKGTTLAFLFIFVLFTIGIWYFAFPPKVINTAEAEATNEVVFEFSSTMNKTSVEESIVTQPKVEGSFQWDSGKKVIFIPTPEYADEPFTITIGSSARDQFGREIQENFSLYFTPESARQAQLSFVVPEDNSEEVGLLQPITLLWDGAVFPLANPEKTQLLLEKNITVTPEAPAGSWQILGTSGILFEPLEQWKGSTLYSVNIPAEITGEEINLEFSTQRIAVEYIGTKKNHDLADNDPVVIEFNQPINAQTVNEFIQVTDQDNRELKFTTKKGTKTTYDEDGNETEEPNDNAVEIIPAKSWPRKETILVQVKEGLTGTQGAIGLRENTEQKIQTIAEFKATFTNIPEYTYDGVSIEFSTVVNAQDIIDALQIEGPDVTPETMKKWKEELTKNIYTDEMQYYYVPPIVRNEWFPGSEYTLSLSNDLSDIFGQSILNNAPVKFTTRYSNQVNPLFFPQSTPTVYTPETDLNFALFYSGEWRTIETKLINNETGNTIDNIEFSPKKDTTKKHLLELPLKELFGAKLYDAESITPGFYSLEVKFTHIDQNNYNPKYRTDFFVSEFVAEAKFTADSKLEIYPRVFPVEENIKSTVKGPYEIEFWTSTWEQTQNKEVFSKSRTIRDWSKKTITLKEDTNLQFIKIIDQNKKIGYVGPNMDDTIRVHDAQNLNYSPWFYTNPIRGAVFTERPLYKPGQKVYVKGLLRTLEGFEKEFPLKNINPEEYESITLRVRDPFWEEVHVQEITKIASSVDASFQLLEDAALGQYSVSIQAKKIGEQYPSSFDGSFYVTQYRKPKFLIQANFESANALDQDTLELSSVSEYAFGGALADKPVKYTISLFGEKCEGDWFWFCESRDRMITSGQGFTDKEGNFNLKTQINLSDIIEEDDTDVTWSLINATITVDESADEQLSKTISIPFASADGQISDLRTDTYFSEPSQTVNITGTLKALDDTPKSNEKVELQVIHNQWARTDRKDSGGNFRGEWQVVEEIIDTYSVTSLKDGTFKKEITAPSEDGDYTIRAVYTDAKGRTAQTERGFWIWGGSDTPQIKLNDQNHILRLLPEKSNYKVGDTINILVPTTDFEIIKKHATLERGSILDQVKFDIETQTMSFVAEPWMSPSITASLLLEGKNTENEPTVYWGAAHIEINNPEKELLLSVTPAQEIYKPGEEVTLEIQTQNNGSGIPAEVTIAVVDASLLALKSRETLNLKTAFFGDGYLPLGVQTTHTLANYVSAQQMKEVQDKIADVMAMAESRMGGGGGKSGEQKPRGDFRDTAHFAASVMTDSDGKATLTFMLPDNTTTWNVWAVANTEEQQFGQSESEFKATYPLVISPIVPNVFQAGDELEIGVLIANNASEGKKESVEIEMTLPDSITGSNKKQTISVMSTERAFFPIKVNTEITEEEIAEITFTAKSSEHSDSLVISRTILPPKTTRFVADMFRVDDDRMTKVISDADALSSRITIHASSSLLQSADALIKNLETRNYGCTEQSFAYWTAVILENKVFGRNLTTLPKEELKAAWDKILKAHRSNSGFVFWDTPYSTPDIWLTTNILEFSDLWAEQGFIIPEDQKNSALDFINRKSQELCVEFVPCADNTTRVYAQYVLAKHKRLTGSQLEIMHEYATTLEAKVWWLMAMNELRANGQASEVGNNKKYAQEIRSDIQRQVRSRDRSLFLTATKGRNSSFYHQDERLTAIFLELALAEDSLISDPTKVAGYLARSNAYEYSTNTSMRTLNAFYKYAERYETNTENIPFAFSISGNTEKTLKGTIKNRDVPYTTTIESKAGNVTQINAQKTSDDYYVAVELSESFRAADTTSVSKGFWIEREFFELNDTKYENPISQMVAGQNYLARVKVITNTNHRQVRIADHIPSGAEFVQFDLDGSDKTLQEYVEDENKIEPYFRQLTGCNGLCGLNPTHKEFDTNQARFYMDDLPAGAHEVKYVITARLSGTFDVLPPYIEEMYNPEVFASGEGSVITIKR